MFLLPILKGKLSVQRRILVMRQPCRWRAVFLHKLWGNEFVQVFIHQVRRAQFLRFPNVSIGFAHWQSNADFDSRSVKPQLPFSVTQARGLGLVFELTIASSFLLVKPIIFKPKEVHIRSSTFPTSGWDCANQASICNAFHAFAFVTARARAKQRMVVASPRRLRTSRT